MVEVKFINKSGERVFLYQLDGSVWQILESGKCWDRNPLEGTLRTSIVSQHEAPPPPQASPKWVDKTEWTTNVPDESIYARYKTITFLDGNVVKLKKRLFWKFPEMDWPVVEFLFTSNKIKMIRERLDRDSSVLASLFLNGIPVRKTVSPLSRYAQYKRWFFQEQPVKNASPKQVTCDEIVQYGEGIRDENELDRIEELKAEEEERQKLKLV